VDHEDLDQLFAVDDEPVYPRLQKFLASSGVASRRKAEIPIRQGRVTVDGEVAHLGSRVSPESDVRVNGLQVGPEAPRYLMLNKPTGVVTTAEDPQGRSTVLDLVDSDVRLYPVGRLDMDTSGLLLLTNDGELAHRLMHPSFGVEKTYSVFVEGKVAPQTARQLATGIELEDGLTSPGSCRIVQATADRSMLELVIHEGKNRQVRRMLDAVGHPVIALSRVKYGTLGLGDLKVGESRALTDTETRRLRKAAKLNPPRRKEADSEETDGT
jgi:23S rRNA pseudouridine2605 synthase